MSTERNLKIYRASAGSGKTFRLAVEFIALLVKNPTAYKNVLAVTFTNKATGEMKQRILSQLYGIAKGLETSRNYLNTVIGQLKDEGTLVDEQYVQKQCDTALTAILHDYTYFHIVTIDSFFQSIVRELANELGVAANTKIELDADMVLRQAVDEIIDNLSVNSPEYDSLVSYIQSRLEDIKNWKIDDAVAEFGKSILSEHFLIHDSSTRDIISNKAILDKYRESLNTFKTTKIGKFNDIIARNAYAAQSAIKETGAEDGFIKHAIDMIQQDWDALKEWKDSYDKYTESADAWVKKAYKNNEAVINVIANTLVPCISNIKEAFLQRIKINNDVEAVRQHIYNLMIIGKIGEQIDTINKDRNRFLMAETAHFLSDVINKSNLPFIYEKTGTVIHNIMIDEFQDTSTLQWQNFMPLLTECLDSGNSCLIVGDVKQSIYRFRNSDWQVLNNIDSTSSPMCHYVNSITPDISINRRSAPLVIEFNNRFFKHALKWAEDNYREQLGSRVETLKTAYKTVEQSSPNSGKSSGYVQIVNAYDAENNEPLQLDYLMKSIAELLKAGVKQEDITILVRKGRHAAEICRYYESNKEQYFSEIGDVNIVSDEAFLLESSTAINMVIFALRSLSAITDRLHLATLAYHYQTLVLGNKDVMADLSLPLLVNDKEMAERYLPDEFMRRRNELRFKPIAEIVEELYVIFQLSRLSGQDAYLFCFHDIIKQYSQDNLADISSFLSAWDDELHAKSIPNGKADGISIMTIHKSKGLEFHTVIVPFCNWSLDPTDSTLLWHSSAKETADNEMPLLPLMPVNYSKTKNSDIFKDNHDEEKLLTLVDNINMLYVALTRAKNNLIVITDEQRAGRSNDTLGVNNLILSFIGEETDYHTGEIVPSGNKAENDENEANPLTRKFLQHNVQFVSEPSQAEFRQSNDSDIFISEMSENDAAIKHADRIRLISLGNLYHNILQNVNTIDDLHPAIMRLDSRGCFERLAERDDTEQFLRSLIENVSKKHPEWFSTDWLPMNERTIMFPSADGNTFSTNRPDRVVVKGDSAIVIDYKTAKGVAVTRPDGSVSAPNENIQQVEHYCELMRQLGFDTVKGYLWYILDDIVCEVE